MKVTGHRTAVSRDLGWRTMQGITSLASSTRGLDFCERSEVSIRDVFPRRIFAADNEPKIYQRGHPKDDLHHPQGDLSARMTIDNARTGLCTIEALTLTASTLIIFLRIYVRRWGLGRWDWSDWMNGMYSERGSTCERLQRSC